MVVAPVNWLEIDTSTGLITGIPYEDDVGCIAEVTVFDGKGGFDSQTYTLTLIYVEIEGVANQLPTDYKLFPNYPNPFNPTTIISYSIPNSGFVTLKVYYILGAEIKTLVSAFQQAGTYSVNFDASKLSSGIYFYRLQVGSDFVEARKMLLMR